MRKSETFSKVCEALVKAQAESKLALKTQNNTYHNSRYSDLASVWSAACDALEKYELFIAQDLWTEDTDKPLTTKTTESKGGTIRECTTTEKLICVTTVIMHSSGEWLEFGPLKMPIHNLKFQEFGSAATYARRYSLSASLCLVSSDDDGQAATYISKDEATLVEGS